jgi:hypothetical protein
VVKLKAKAIIKSCEAKVHLPLSSSECFLITIPWFVLNTGNSTGISLLEINKMPTGSYFFVSHLKRYGSAKVKLFQFPMGDLCFSRLYRHA